MSGSFESMRWNTCVHRLDLGLYSHAKEFLGNGVGTNVNSEGIIPFIEAQRIEPTTLYHSGKQARRTTDWATSAPISSLNLTHFGMISQ